MGRLVQRFGRLIPGEVLDARGEADAILRSARAQADALLDEARAAAATIRQEAHRQGETEGRVACEDAFSTLMIAARADAQRVRADAVPAARTLALRMAEKIVGRAIELDPATLAHIASDALMAAHVRTGVVLLRVHPEDLATLETARPALVARLASAVDLRLVADAAVGRAGC
ncbi:MAG: hypothetical protein H7X95_05505, partial [Deltaproteobacteria bacterium]|nr:hypothetical protein [Deltaproteobacteria bacterium]